MAALGHCAIALGLWIAPLSVALAPGAGGADAGRDTASRDSSRESDSARDGNKDSAGAGKKNGTVLTFYGLRKLEEDPNIPDDEKLKEWQAFIERATEQIQYAKKAVDRWKNAARVRLVETARNSDRDPKLDAKEKIRHWDEVVRYYPKDAEARTARKRIAYWTQEQTKKLVEAAEDVERGRRPKVERIKAWLEVLAWTNEGPEAKAANKRIDGLQQQLYSEAQSVDSIARVDDKTKLAAWRDVLAGRPSAQQEKLASRRVAELEAAVGGLDDGKEPAARDAGAHDGRDAR
jgi:hypothetical protein